MDANLVGGDIAGGLMDIRHFIFRPTWGHYATSARDIYICSASTPPGGGVHGMCGYHAAKMALSRWHRARVVAEKFDAAFDLGWSSASACCSNYIILNPALAAEVAVYFPGMSFSAPRAVCQL